MRDSEAENEYISRKIFKDNQIVSYSQLSKDQNIPLSKAKAILYEFFKSNKQRLNASFIIIGYKNSIKNIQFVPQETQVNDALERFDYVSSVHIYAVNLNEFDFAIGDVVLSQIESLQDETQYERGVIRGPPLVEAGGASDSAAGATVGTNSAAVTTPKSKPEPEKPKSFNSTLSSNYVSRKAKPSPKHQTTAPKYEYKSRKIQNQPPKREKVVISQIDDDDDVDISKRTIDKDANKKLSAMFDDDDFSDEEPKQKELEVSEMEVDEVDKVPESLAKREELEEPKEDQMEDIQEPAPELVAESEPEPVAPEYDAEGYLITRRPAKPSSKGSSKNGAATKPTEAKTAKSTGSAKSKNTKKQASLMNFFGKKKQ